MRIAWIGPIVKGGRGASGVALQLLQELGSRCVEVDCYMVGEQSSIPKRLKEYKSLSFHCLQSPWKWNRWYSRNNLMAFATGQFVNLLTENRLAQLLYINHLSNPYDLIYQFSHIELSSLRRYRKHLPPIVLHPSVHAAGELRWHKKEFHISRSSEKWFIRVGVRLLLTVRSIVQRRHIRFTRRVLALSKTFAIDLMSDYKVASGAIEIVPNPVDLSLFHPGIQGGDVTVTNGRTVILFVSRIAQRKGVEQIVELSHRLDDLADEIEIQVVGYKSLWSDYMHLLESLNPRNTLYIGEVPGEQMAEIYRTADMLVQPSKYEPFGLTVGEALASGLPVVTSDTVGAGESVHPFCCRRFPCGNIDVLEQEVRKLLLEISDGSLKEKISTLARTEAERLYSSSVIGDKLLSSFGKLVSAETSTVDTGAVLEFRGNL